jgi:hypothetical protein
MRRRIHALLAGSFTAAALLVPVCAYAQADQPAEFSSWDLPGWTFTPGVTVGWLRDTNVGVAFPSVDTGSTAADNLFELEPFASLEYNSGRTRFSSNYNGFIRRYFDFNELNSLEQRASVSLRHAVTRRLTVTAGNAFLRAPTTDQVELNGVPFERNGSRYDSGYFGLEGRLSRTVDAKIRYTFVWVDFERKDTLLTGGIVNGVSGDISRAIDRRSSVGGEYSVRWANLNGGTRQLSFQNAGALYRYRVAEHTSFELAAGIAHLIDNGHDVRRSGLYFRTGLDHQMDRGTVGISYERSYVPSFSFGGSNQSQETRGYLMMPLRRNRLYAQESASWRRTDPLLAQELPLDSIGLRTTIGYAVQRWFRVEGYHAFSRQDTRLEPGQINRNVIGVQFVVARPVRIQQ